MYLLTGGIHYAFDSCVKLHAYRFGIFNEECKLLYFMHHICTVIMFRSMWMIDHYPWFIAFPPGYHCVMVGFPRFAYNNYIYAVALISFFYMNIMIPTFWKNRVHNSLIIDILVIAIPISFMATMDCQSQWDLAAMVKEHDAMHAAR